MKKITPFAVFAVTVGVVGLLLTTPAQALISLDTGNTRTNVKLRDEEQVINQFESSLTAYRTSFTSILGTVDSETVASRADAVYAANEALQSKSFSPSLNDEFRSAVEEYKKAANSATQAVRDTAELDYSDETRADTSRATIAEASASLEPASESLETAAKNYNPGEYNWIVFLAIGVVAAVLVVGGTILYRRKQSKDFARITRGDAGASQLSKQQRKTIMKLYEDISLYDTALASNNTALLSGLELGVYQKVTKAGGADALSIYAQYYYELDALVKLRAGDTQSATQSAVRAAGYRGADKLVTARVRNLAGPVANS